MTQFTFTPGQKEEALSWLQKNCPELHKWLSTLPEDKPELQVLSIKDSIIDVYFKMKKIKFDFKSKEFIVGIEYKDKDKVISGEEAINIAIHNPHLSHEYDIFAHQALVYVLQKIKG